MSCDNCLFNTFELFVSISDDDDEFCSRITLIVIAGIDDVLASSIICDDSFDVLSPLVEQIADEGEARF